MATIITGKELALTVDSVSYDTQATSVTLTMNAERSEYDVLDGTVYKTLKNTGTLDVELLADWGAVGSICEALWTAANTAPDTPIDFTLIANTGATFTGEVLPAFPAAGGAASGELTASVSLTVVNGDVTLA